MKASKLFVKSAIKTLALTVLTLSESVSVHALNSKAEDLVLSVIERNQGDDRVSNVELIQTFDDGFIRNRSLVMYEKEFGKERKGILYFTAPSNTAGTGLLMHSYAQDTDKDDSQWIYLPALRKVKRIATNSKEGPFLGTDFSFADIERKRITEYKYTYKGQIKMNNSPVHVVEAKTEDGLENPRTGYNRRIIYIDSNKNLIIKEEIFRQDVMIKIFEVLSYEKIDNYWTVTESRMTNLIDGGNTRLVRKNTKYNQKLKDRLFTQRAIRKGIN